MCIAPNVCQAPPPLPSFHPKACEHQQQCYLDLRIPLITFNRRCWMFLDLVLGESGDNSGEGGGGAHNNSALNSEVVLLVQPDLHLLPTLEEPENKIDLHQQGG